MQKSSLKFALKATILAHKNRHLTHGAFNGLILITKERINKWPNFALNELKEEKDAPNYHQIGGMLGRKAKSPEIPFPHVSMLNHEQHLGQSLIS